MRLFSYIWIFLFFLTGCATYRPIQRELLRHPALADHFTGIALYDWEKQKMLVQHNADRYFTPASNTKLFSFYAGLTTLKDSIPTLRYVVRGDSMIIWGTGDGSFLNPDLPKTAVLPFLQNRPERLFLSFTNFSGNRLGSGWAWDDYNDYYSAEVTPFPLYGNIVRFSAPNRSSQLLAAPSFFQDSLSPVSRRPTSLNVQRDEFGNQFDRPHALVIAGERLFRQDVPFRWSPGLAAQLLADTLNRTVGLADIPFDRSAKTVYGLPADSLYKRMMQVSDNMLAEHLVLLASSTQDTISTSFALEKILQNHLSDLPDRPIWVDGSGLSRYNLFTPRSLVALLQKIYRAIPEERLFNILAAGGRSGTIRSGYKPGQPYVFAKSGSMSGVYNLSGYLITKKGKLLLFSMMHNSFPRPVSEMRKWTAAFLTEIHERY